MEQRSASAAVFDTVPAATAWAHSWGKRVFDMALAGVSLVVASGPLLVLAALIRATSPGPAIYAARRVGRGGKPFDMYKLRSMVADADRLGPAVTAGGDRRVTSLGRVLRKTKLDELPALWNVFVGQMSFVGPRPENPDSVNQYTLRQRTVLSVRPGLTSLASIKYRHEEELLARADDVEAGYFAIMQDKLGLDLEYLERASLATDLRILALTVGAILRVHPATA
jgi:lipopolysaccharide/colanic/teichoic acid biosynthesis glycosyltransferase